MITLVHRRENRGLPKEPAPQGIRLGSTSQVVSRGQSSQEARGGGGGAVLTPGGSAAEERDPASWGHTAFLRSR